ncbi:MAG: hypothetical protein AAFW81_04500 [Pseudomonadota bacterium]
MIIERGETRSLLAWLTSQERVLQFWIDECAASAPPDDTLVEKLEEHRFWLLSCIDDIAEDAA